MTITNNSPAVHRVLSELGLPLPMAQDTSWALTRLDEGSTAPPDCRITLTAAGELFIEIPDASHFVERYGFDAQGCLVSLSHGRHFEGPLFEQLRQQILSSVRSRCLLGEQQGTTHDLQKTP